MAELQHVLGTAAAVVWAFDAVAAAAAFAFMVDTDVMRYLKGFAASTCAA
jgi:hypothetical protein